MAKHFTPFWQSDDGAATLYHGDCLEILSSFPPASVDHVLTDPPYSSGGQFRGDRMQTTRSKYQSTGVVDVHPDFSGDNRDQRAWLLWSTLWLSKCLDACVPGGLLCMFSDWRQLPTATDAIQAGGWVWRGVIVWDKVNGRPMPDRFTAQAEFIPWATAGPREFSMVDARYHKGVVRACAPPTRDREHSTQKPVAVMAHLVAATSPGDTILDPFAGSGTTALACRSAGRRFVGIEKERKNCQIAVRRIEEDYRRCTAATAPLNRIAARMRHAKNASHGE